MAEVFDFGLQQHKIKMDGKFFENNLFAVAGDTGRRLEVQLLDSNNLVQNTTGISLRLNADVAGQATYAEATLVDATKGLYELDLPNGMLIAPGNWQFQWQIIGTSGKKLHSIAFTGNVGKNISEGGSQATNFYLNLEDLKAMQEDLVNGTIDSSILETNITEKLTNLETQYAPKLTEVTAQLAETATTIKERGISVKKFGTKGDGIADDTLKIQEAIDYCANNRLILVFPFGTYNVSTLTLKTGIVGLQSYGAVIKANAKSGEGVIASTLSSKVSDYFVDGFSIDCNGLGRRGFFGNGNRIRITNNNIYGLNNSTNSEQGIRFFKSSSYNTVKDNTITLGMDVPFGTFPSLAGIHFSGTPSSLYAGLDIGDNIIQGTDLCTHNLISGNVVEGGTHGIHLIASNNNIISDNLMKNQTHRNIILSPLASYNKVDNNQCSEFGSAGIHIAYGSSNNMISGNNLYSSGALMIASSGGEGAIQSYVHSKNNTIIGNNIYAKTTKYGIYSAIHCNGLVVKGNVVEGGLRASIAIESDWNSTLLPEELYGRPNYEPPINPSWISWDNGKNFENITIKDNTIQSLTTGYANCGIYIAQSQNAIMSCLVVEGNVINSLDNSGKDFYVYVKDPAKFTNNNVRFNTITPMEILHVTFTNPDIKLISYDGNNWQNRILTIATPTNVLDISKTNYIILNASMTIDTIKGILVDTLSSTPRIIILKLSIGVVLKHNNSNMRLRGDADITATSGNHIVTLIAISGVLFETSRNF